MQRGKKTFDYEKIKGGTMINPWNKKVQKLKF